MHGGEAHARTPKIVGVPHSPLIGRQTEQRIIYIVAHFSGNSIKQ